MRPHLYMALLLFGFLLLTACSGDDIDNTNVITAETGTSSCTLGSSALNSCRLD